MKILFLASGNGGTMKFVHQAIDVLNLDAKIVGVISDRECGAIEYAIKNSIPSMIFTPWKEKVSEIANEIERYSPDIVVTNIHKILPPEIFTCCKAKFINLHYSLLPAFGGVIGFKTLEMAKEANTRIIGATCHYVTEELDGGRVISQAAIPVDWSCDMDDIGDQIFRIACETILNGILMVSMCKLGDSSMKSNIIYSPQLLFDNTVFNNNFWNKIKQL